MAAHRDLFTTVRSEGALLPPDFLQRIAEGDKEIPGLTPDSYHLPPREKLTEAITRSWNRMLGFWSAFQSASASLKQGDPGTGFTRDKWLLPLFQELGYGRLPAGKGFEIEGRSYPISHVWQNTPIHLLGRNVDLDRPTKGVAGAARHSPHGLVQEFLNRHEGHLWGLLGNGLKLRILRDNKSLTRQACVEFDLAGMMDGQVYSDFAVLWLLCHQSRVEAERAEQCWLEEWSQEARERGTRALDSLRDGVQQAIEALGRGFLAHPANNHLVEKLREGALDKQDYYRQLLRTVYRLIFLFVAEDRDLLLTAPHGSKERERYLEHYSAQRLRRLAERRRGSPHPDLWQGLRLVFDKLSSNAGCKELGLPALGSFLWSEKATPDLDRCAVANTDLLAAVRALAFTVEGKVRRTIDYRNLGAEELGSVYESLLELHPDVNADAPTFSLIIVSGHERKTTGSYYTHTSIIDCLLDSALEPVLDRAAKHPQAEKAILGLKVCDPACGSGHFLIAAGHRIANRLAAIRTGDEEPSPQAIRAALRDAIGHCLYGVDINPMAVELCKVNLWLDALEPGKPLSFLEHRVRVGNSLVGVTPVLLEAGIPNDAFKPVHGDDAKFCAVLKKKNDTEKRQLSLADISHQLGAADAARASALATLDASPDDTLQGVIKKQEMWEALTRSEDFVTEQLTADAWVAAFFWTKIQDPSRPWPVTEESLRRIRKERASAPPGTLHQVRQLAEKYRFFHWHLAFPDVFQRSVDQTTDPLTGWAGGFDVVLGNPPWETLSPDVKEFFAALNPEVRFADKAGQDAILADLLGTPATARLWDEYQRDLYALVHFLKSSGRYRLFAPGNLGKGDFNAYRMFVETALQTTRPGGYATQVVPAGFYGGANAMAIRQELYEHWSLHRVLGFINTGGVWFKGVDQTTRFCAYSACRGDKTAAIEVAFSIRKPEDLASAMQGNMVTVAISAIQQQSPKALAISELSSSSDVALVTQMYERWPKFGDTAAGPPTRTYMRELDMGTDRWRFVSEQVGFPVYEGRMVDQFDHRAKAYREGRGRAAVWEPLDWGNPGKAIIPQWFVPEDKLPDKVRDRVNQYRLGFCDVTAPRNERSLVAALIPPGAVCGDKVPTITFAPDLEWAYMLWLGVANSFCMDYLARKKVALKMSFTVVDSLPFARLQVDDPVVSLLCPIALRLTCTSCEMTSYWNSMAQYGWCQAIPSDAAPPGLFTEGSRAVARAEIDAIVARRIFGLSRADLSQVLETFPIVKRRDLEEHGHYRTSDLILKAYDAIESSPEPTSRSATSA